MHGILIVGAMASASGSCSTAPNLASHGRRLCKVWYYCTVLVESHAGFYCRIYSEKTSRRAREDARKEAKKEARETAEVCEHGVKKCRICNPHTDKVDHRATAVNERTEGAECS
jgi:hypothetical protein